MNTDKIIAEKIASEYAPKSTREIIALKKLDKYVRKGATTFAYIFGSISSLVMGAGMSFSMGIIGGNTFTSVLVGIIIGLVGITGVSVNYPIYKIILNKSKNKYRNDILRISQEIIDESK